MPTPPVLLASPVTVKFPGLNLLPGLDIKVLWRPKAFNFAPQQNASGREVIVSASAYPTHEFDLIFNVLRNRNLTDVEFKTLMGFWQQCNGVNNPFLFSNPYDFIAAATSLGATDGTTSRFTITRNFGANGYGINEPIGVLDATQTFNLYIDGVLKPSSDPTYGYQVDLSVPWNQQLVFNSAPSGVHSITADFTFWYFARLGNDQTEFEQVLYQVWSNPKLTIVTKKANA